MPTIATIGARARYAGKVARFAVLLPALTGPVACNRQPARPGSTQPAALVTAAGTITGTADDQRTGWYPNQPRLEPPVVGGPTFGRL
jgi:hypothetical protein